MAKKPSAKQLERFLLRKVLLLQDNMGQWAQADVFLGLEKGCRYEQVVALIEDNQERAIELHNQRIRCLQQALEILTTCPACGPHEETPDDPDPTE